MTHPALQDRAAVTLKVAATDTSRRVSSRNKSCKVYVHYRSDLQLFNQCYSAPSVAHFHNFADTDNFSLSSKGKLTDNFARRIVIKS